MIYTYRVKRETTVNGRYLPFGREFTSEKKLNNVNLELVSESKNKVEKKAEGNVGSVYKANSDAEKTA